MHLGLASSRSGFTLKSSSKGFQFIIKIFVLICFMVAFIFVLIYVVFGFNVDNFVNQEMICEGRLTIPQHTLYIKINFFIKNRLPNGFPSPVYQASC
jgi:hypothetical protein